MDDQICGVPLPQRWQRQPGEPSRWFQQFERFRLLGPTRSLLIVFNQWRVEKCREVSSRAPGTWRRQAELWRWRERAEAWDTFLSDQVAREAEAERKAILSQGFAQEHERIQALNGLAKLLESELYEDEKRWLPDVKQVGSGEAAERVDLVRFNAPLVEQFRKALEDLAAETGGRVKNIDMKSGGQPFTAIREIVVELPSEPVAAGE